MEAATWTGFLAYLYISRLKAVINLPFLCSSLGQLVLLGQPRVAGRFYQHR